MRFRRYIQENTKTVHWKKSKFSTYAACDKRGAENLKLENCQHTDQYQKVTCKKCQKEVMMIKRVNRTVFEATKIIKVYKNKEYGIEAHVAKVERGFSVSLKDTDAGEFVGINHIFPKEKDAHKKAKQIVESKKSRYYAEVRTYDDNGDDWVHDTIDDITRTPEALLNKAIKWSKKNLKGEGKIKINVFDTQHPKHGTWNIISKELKV